MSVKYLSDDFIQCLCEYRDYVDKQSQDGSKAVDDLGEILIPLCNFVHEEFKLLKHAVPVSQVMKISGAEIVVKLAIKEGMENNIYYKEIYQLAKKRVESFAEIHGKTLIPGEFKYIEAGVKSETLGFI